MTSLAVELTRFTDDEGVVEDEDDDVYLGSLRKTEENREREKYFDDFFG